MQGTATVTICRCGWVAIGPNFEVAATAYNEHKAETPGTIHDPRKVFCVSNPVTPEALREFKRIAHIESCDTKALEFLGRYKKPDQPRVQDDGLGCFRGMWTVCRWYAVAGVVALCCYGLWRLR